MTERLEHYRNLSDISDKWRVKENRHFFFKIFFVILEYLNIFTSVIMQHQQPQKKTPNPKQQYRFNVHNKKNCMFLKSYLWGYINSFQRKYSFCRQWTPQIYQRWVLAHTQTAADNDISCEVHTDSSGCPVILWSASFTNIRGRFT